MKQLYQYLTELETNGSLRRIVRRTHGGIHYLAAAGFEQTIAKEYGNLSKQLQAAADYVIENQIDVASRSLRSLSAASGLSPATFSRLARALGFDSYEAFREMLRGAVSRQVASFSDKVVKLQAEAHRADVQPFIQRQSAACAENISNFSHQVEPEKLAEVVDKLHNARNVRLFGALSSAGIIEYMSYLANYFTDGWSIAGTSSGSFGADISGLGHGDVLLVLTKPPFAMRSIQAAELAAKRGAWVVVITDTHTCPALSYADTAFIVPTDSPQFFSSYAATLVLVETIIGMLVARSGSRAQSRISDVGTTNQHLGELWGA